MSAIGVVAGTAIDQLAGEPPIAWHPVARYGSLMQRIERRLHADRRSNGLAHLAVGVAAAAVIGAAVQGLLGRRAGTALAVALCAAGKMLDDEALAMRDLLQRDELDSARQRVRALVGRDPSSLDAEELSRAVIESVAENLVDAVTATVCWGALAGPTGAFAHRAVNTLDAMVGHRNERYERFGWASARLDDAMNYVPARLTAAAVAIATPRRAREVWRIVRRDAPHHPSPNGGVVEAAFAAALGITLGGVNRYGDTIEDRGTLGDGPMPTVGHIGEAVMLRRRTTAVTAGLVAAVTLVRSYARRSR